MIKTWDPERGDYKMLVGLDPTDPTVLRLLAAIEERLSLREATIALAAIVAGLEQKQDLVVEDSNTFALALLSELAMHGLTITKA